MNKTINALNQYLADLNVYYRKVQNYHWNVIGQGFFTVHAKLEEIYDGVNEKIDIVNWSDNMSEYIREALSPAEIIKVELEDKRAKVYVSEDQQSVAIGRQGQNVRLASKLTGIELDIELAEAPKKKKRGNAEDSLLSALEDSSEE